ncbi:MAG: hypothetical protein IT311_08470 [Anaerolineales bacterium]|nr:hypothetical protein [Anaerolineales bacterium]MCZ2122946.1 hypothetical protein [Anaerolineales bacterium]
MHRHHFRHRPKRLRGFFPGFFWIFIMLMIFSKGNWWPAFLIILGIWFFFSAIFREDKQPPLAPPEPAAPIQQKPTPQPVSVEPRREAGDLPTNCPKCGGPVRAYEVKWTGAQNAACAYCGANLKSK